MKCPECREAQLESRRENYRYTESGLANVILVDAEVRQCPSCGYRGVAIPAIEKLHRLLAMSVIRQRSPLGPQEIRFLRKWLGHSSADFAEIMGVDPATVSRWESAEKPQAMGATADRLLRMLIARGEPVEEYPIERLAEISASARPDMFRVSRESNTWRLGRVDERAS